ncbi:hypothetical protein [Photobacterium phosphoreum]|uniref:hypothetical protein n=1 Tax=Photobacterium phosphoreum TaxID=659 RepID=UPI001E2BF092|nr:hypothetical protein [Photobacterium phosphoreum]MCD9477280.1 hypothetical protein [Photobacterium phosphoreum]MCF2178102.1 hypothetical protein [Photobacterium phosphoreum]
MILYDPHVDDNIFTPLSYFVGKRKGLNKYRYIYEAWSKSNNPKIYISNKTSSLPLVITSKIPSFLLKYIIKLEVKIWLKLNNLSATYLTSYIKDGDVFCFGYKKFDKITHDEVKMTKSFTVHLTHYHTYKYNSIYLEDNFKFVYDNNVSSLGYFNLKFPGYNKDIKIISFYVQDRFFIEPLNDQRKGVAVTGTYHDYAVDELDFGIYENGRTTLHPVRHEISRTIMPDNFKLEISLFKNPNKLSTLLKNIGKYNQKAYFSFNIVEFYNESKYSLVAGEGTGAIAIGALESMAVGCKPFLTNTEVCGLNLPSNSYVLYETLHDVCIYDNNDIIDKEQLRHVAREFNYESSLKRFNNYIKSI